ncbi:hypothetical protein BO94DRAFT_487511 [Aspergillus sclerotioniger CBS 115572]|uniref:Uncharacterized protein n=1 Tax=Aspergillus sclerotioniger CBS 115572 TaxID=1450535 RepID=A0A317X641_9EURO|nr:hypothetical protein BO94DRAFT_487511 [Aspergillus sclerotioniger CBS 115572]PWY93027.1 hypothetical protein BO94DRAFT_487511 [Aspergillus sclerotioniger CBS 115572]
MAAPPSQIVEGIFLEFSIEEILTRNTQGFPVVEPWATDYVNAVRDKRYGDAIWARYHIAGDVHDGISEEENKPVLEVIEDEALNYKVSDPEAYAEALVFYADTSSADGHPEVMEIIRRIGNMDTTELRAKYEREQWEDHIADF